MLYRVYQWGAWLVSVGLIATASAFVGFSSFFQLVHPELIDPAGMIIILYAIGNLVVLGLSEQISQDYERERKHGEAVGIRRLGTILCIPPLPILAFLAFVVLMVGVLVQGVYLILPKRLRCIIH